MNSTLPAPQSDRRASAKAVLKLAVLALLVLATWRLGRCGSRAGSDQEVVIDIDAAGKASFPASLHADPIGFGLRPELSEPAMAAKATIRSGLDKYPPGFVGRYLHAIHVVSNLSFDGVQVGGTCLGGTMYISVRPGQMYHPQANAWTEQALHHEFGHAILERDGGAFDRGAWSNANVAGFRYAQGGFKYLAHRPTFDELSDLLIQNGFVSDYSRSAMEEDFCEILSVMFTADPPTWQLLLDSPRLCAKAKVVAQFLHSLDSRLSWAYFEDLHRRLDLRDTMRTTIRK